MSGAKSFNSGREFEKLIKDHCALTRIMCVRVPHEIRNFYTGTPIQVKVEFDYCLGVDGRAVFLDAKASKEPRINFKSAITNKKKIHQLNHLASAYELGNVSGYLMHFYSEKVFSWASAPVVMDLLAANHLNLTPDSPGIVTMSSNEPLNIRELLKNDFQTIGG